MEIGKKYKIIGEYLHTLCPQLQPEGTIVQCVEDKGNGFFVVKLIDKSDRNLDENIGGWMIDSKKIFFEDSKINTK
jgi:hypothetical protein